VGGLLAIATAALTAFLVWPNTAPEYHPPPRSASDELPVEEEAEPPTVGLAPAAQAAALQTARSFVKTAILRQNVAAAWQLTTPNLRQGMTREEWNTGNIPVAQFPATALREIKWRVAHSYLNDLEFEILLLPKEGKAGQGLGSITYVFDMKAVGAAARKHWVVDAWRPYGFSQPPFSASGNAAREGASSKLSAIWLLIPASLFALVALLPLGLFFRSWRQGKRAEQAYRAYRERAT
jgi:hypothetical protein